MTQRIAYFDCFSGAAGDMLLAALLDAGLSLDDLRADLAHLSVQGYDIEVSRAQQHGLTGAKFDVLDTAGERPARNLTLIREVLQASDLPDSVVSRSLDVFTRLGEAEAHVHGVTLEEVHFHEVGAIDALVDIVGFCCALERLAIDAIYASPLPLGSGTIRTEHGLLPVPAPATLALLAAAGAPTYPLDARSELVTPTGAAILTALATFERPAMRVTHVGYGFGTKVFPWANMVRVWIGDQLDDALWKPRAAQAKAQHTHSHAHAHSHDHADDNAHSHGHDHAHGHGHGHDHDHDHPDTHSHNG